MVTGAFQNCGFGYFSAIHSTYLNIDFSLTLIKVILPQVFSIYNSVEDSFITIS